MAGRSLATRLRGVRGGSAVGWAALGLGLLVGLAAVSSALVEVPGRTAPWVPAIGVLAAAALIAGRRWRRPVIVVGSFAITIGALVAGRPLEFSLLLTLCRIIEMLVLCRLLGATVPRLDSLRGVLRYIGSSAIAATVFAIGVLVVRLLPGVETTPTPPIDSLIAHLVAFLVVTPLVLIRRQQGGRARGPEIVVQWSMLLVAIAIVFSPANALPLAFLPLPVFAWAAVRMSATTVALQLLVVAVMASTATMIGWGPFGADALALDTRGAIALLQTYLVIFAGSTLVLWARRVEGETRAERESAKDNILRRAVEGAQTGLLLAERLTPGVYVVVQANTRGLRLLDLDPEDDFFAASSDINVALPPEHPLISGLDAVTVERPQWRGPVPLVLATGPREMDVVIERGSGEASEVLAIELTDVTAAREEDRRLRAIVERERALSSQYQELARQKDDFLASVSHELRTPLASIVGYLETLDETDLDSQQQRFVATIRRNADRLQDRVEELLSAAKRAADAVDEPHALDAGRIIGEVADDLQAVAASRSVTIRVESWATELPLVVGTEDSIARVMTNVMSNAVKFAPPGSAVTVAATGEAENVVVEVCDDGPGIPPADQEKVFERFYRADHALDNAVPGTGLGLSIVRTLLEGIGGRISIHSDGVQGTRVRVALRRSETVTAEDAPNQV